MEREHVFIGLKVFLEMFLDILRTKESVSVTLAFSLPIHGIAGPLERLSAPTSSLDPPLSHWQRLGEILQKKKVFGVVPAKG